LTLTTAGVVPFAIYAPPQPKQYIIYNNTAYAATIYNSTSIGNTTAAGTGVIVPAGKKLVVFSDATNFYTIEASNLTGVLAVANGGTGVTTSTGTGNTVLSTSPTLTTPVLGTPASGTLDNCTSNTEAFGNSTTQLATTAFVQAALAALHPVGSIYTATVATNPGTLLGFGTWVAFGAGRVMVGVGGGFSAGATGGSADAITVSHTHTATSTVTDPGHFHEVQGGTGLGVPSGGGVVAVNNATGGIAATSLSSVTSITVATTNASAGSSGTNANLQPYIVVYMWNRTV
jgi:hypothetical protein